jgi:hypothetical protein
VDTQLSDEKQIVQAAASVLIDAALRLLQEDPHRWSDRPCPTCRSVSEIAGKPFGCVLYSLQKNKGVAA